MGTVASLGFRFYAIELFLLLLPLCVTPLVLYSVTRQLSESLP